LALKALQVERGFKVLKEHRAYKENRVRLEPEHKARLEQLERKVLKGFKALPGQERRAPRVRTALKALQERPEHKELPVRMEPKVRRAEPGLRALKEYKGIKALPELALKAHKVFRG
jgi:hypothetical protein